METYDVIVVGTGGVGSATLLALARRGVRVLGLDQFSQAHRSGSSHGQTRMIRQAYFEHADYVPLVIKSYELWRELESMSGADLLHCIGLVEAGPPDGVVVPRVVHSAEQHHLELEHLSPKLARSKYGLVIPDHFQVVFETAAGYLLVESCVQTMLDVAEQNGATWLQRQVTDWQADDGEVVIRTVHEEYRAAKVVFCGGAWSGQLLRQIGVPLRILAKHQYWFSGGATESAKVPAFFLELPHGYFYGFPDVGERGMKIARHSGGTPWGRSPRPGDC